MLLPRLDKVNFSSVPLMRSPSLIVVEGTGGLGWIDGVGKVMGGRVYFTAPVTGKNFIGEGCFVRRFAEM